MSRAIPPDLEPEVLKKYGEGWRSRKIAEWLGTEHGVTCSHAAVARIVAHARTERADVAKEVVREKLSKDLPGDLDALQDSLDKAKKLEGRLHARAHRFLDVLDRPLDKDTDPQELKLAVEGVDTFAELALKASATSMNVAKTRLHFSGADTPDSDADAASVAEQSFNSRMSGLAARLRKGGVVPEPEPR